MQEIEKAKQLVNELHERVTEALIALEYARDEAAQTVRAAEAVLDDAKVTLAEAQVRLNKLQREDQ